MTSVASTGLANSPITIDAEKQSATKTCQDANGEFILVVNNYGTDKPVVFLTLPRDLALESPRKGKPDLGIAIGEPFPNKGTCERVEGADETAYTCYVALSTDDGYQVFVGSPGDDSVVASLKYVALATAEADPIPLTCK
jgi:hypothetical protein